MTKIHYFSPQPDLGELPEKFVNPFNKNPHPMAMLACSNLQSRLQSQVGPFDQGGMLGVLVVKDKLGQVGYLSAFTGKLDRNIPNIEFVPRVINFVELKKIKNNSQDRLIKFQRKINDLENQQIRINFAKNHTLLLDQMKNELANIEIIHKDRKNARQEIRRSLTNIKDRENRLKKLAFESQRDRKQRKSIRNYWQSKIRDYEIEYQKLDQEICYWRGLIEELNESLRQRTFKSYILENWLGQKADITEIVPPSKLIDGTGECAATKLIHYACRNALIPLAITEFWWGKSPIDRIYHHAHLYPPCRGRCGAIFPFMLGGIDIDEEIGPIVIDYSQLEPLVVYEDNDIVVVNKPSGMLSVPGKRIIDSVQARLRQRYPQATGPLLLHRLDLATSGLLIAAKNQMVHKSLQHQFENRQIKKRYVAILSNSLNNEMNHGIINLPMCSDYIHRPRQLVCFKQGKHAETRWEVLSKTSEFTRINFYPITGRTHQLRVHAAHKLGLNTAIVGDELYGNKAERLLLHSEKIGFTHPITKKWVEVVSNVPF